MQRQAHKREYDKTGFIKVEGLLGAEELQSVREALKSYISVHLPALPPEDYVLEADGASVRNLWRMEQHDGFFQALACNPELLGLVEVLVNGPPVLMGVETFNKAAKVGSGIPPHQDNAYFCQTPPDVLTVWIALDAATPENGPIVYLPGSHKEGLRPHVASGVQGNSRGLAEGPSEETLEQAYMGLLNPGDALIHHCETIHFSEPNHSDAPRCGLLLVYRGAHTQTDPDLQKVYQEGLAAQ